MLQSFREESEPRHGLPKACEDPAAAGVDITRPPGPMRNGTRVIAFCEDPDGCKVEINESILKHLAAEEN